MIHDEFIFQRNDDIGAAAAEDDSTFLADCFIDIGDLSALEDCDNPRRIIVGRTGAGKSALISVLKIRNERYAQLSPHSLALNFIANSDVVNFFEAAGVSLAPFYGLLWRHLLVVELLKLKFNIRDEASQANYTRYMEKVLTRKDRNKEQAVEYLTKWGNKFWLTSEERVHELVSRVEGSLKASIGGSSIGVPLNFGGAKQLTQEQRSIVENRGREAVSKVQIRELENIITVLAEDIFIDHLQRFYITIDTLDEDWVDDKIKLQLIKTLLDSVRKLRQLKYVKVILAIRQDLLDRVLHFERSPGFQEEKYESLYLDIVWTRDQLYELTEKRLQKLVRRRYTRHPITFQNLFVGSVDGRETFDYLLDRTFRRPRDIILFVNECIRHGENRSQITPTMVKAAEEAYSYRRLQSLATEWQGIHPNLLHVLKMFRGMQSRFEVSELTREFFENQYMEVLNEIEDPSADRLTKGIQSLYSPQGNFNSVRSYFLRDLYTTGFLGIKSSPQESIHWSYLSRYSMSPGEIKGNSAVYIHPTFCRALSINRHEK